MQIKVAFTIAIMIVSSTFLGCSWIMNRPTVNRTSITTTIAYDLIKKTNLQNCEVYNLNIYYLKKRKRFILNLPKVPREQLFGAYNFRPPTFQNNRIIFSVDVSGPSARSYELVFPVYDKYIGSPTVKYKSYGHNITVCYSVPSKSRVDLCKNAYTDSCYQVQRLEHPRDSFAIEYSTPDNRANRLIIRKGETTDEGIEVLFPNTILWYVPENDFAVISLSERRADTLKSYFSLHKNGSWYLDSLTKLNTGTTTIMYKKLMQKTIL